MLTSHERAECVRGYGRSCLQRTPGASSSSARPLLRTSLERLGERHRGARFARRKQASTHGLPRLARVVRSRRVADRDLGARTRPKAAAWRRACRAEQGPCPAERDACRRTKAGRHGGAGTSKPSSPARHAAETWRGWCLRARRRSPVPAGSRWRRAVASPRARLSAADEGGRPLPAALHFSSYTAQKALMRP
jgi:hypothetical protein